MQHIGKFDALEYERRNIGDFGNGLERGFYGKVEYLF